MYQRVFVGLGSNQGEPIKHLNGALAALDAHAAITVLQCSSFYRSKPMGPQDQPDFVNAVAWLQTSLAPLHLLNVLQDIERQHGRQRKAERWGPRTLDLDILLIDDLVLNLTRLVVPHYGLKAREFVLYPLQELVPDLVLPDGDKLASVLHSCGTNQLERIMTTETQ